MANLNGSTTQADADAMSISAPVDALDERSEDHAHATVSNSESNSKSLYDVRMANIEKNIGRWTDREKASEAGRIGGAKSAIVKKKRKLLRESAQQILSANASKLPVPEMGDVVAALKALGVDDITGADAIVLAQYLRALRGDTEAFRAIRDTSGEKPSVAVDVTATDRPVDADSVAQLSDAELIALADGAEDAHALPPPMLQ